MVNVGCWLIKGDPCDSMPAPLPSRVFSTETLVAGLDMAAAGIGMDRLADASCLELQQELQQLEELVDQNMSIGNCSSCKKWGA